MVILLQLLAFGKSAVTNSVLEDINKSEDSSRLMNEAHFPRVIYNSVVLQFYQEFRKRNRRVYRVVGGSYF